MTGGVVYARQNPDWNLDESAVRRRLSKAAKVSLLPIEEAHNLVPPNTTMLTSPLVDIAAMARFAATADPALYPPEAAYIRDADAKPQEKFRVARVPA